MYSRQVYKQQLSNIGYEGKHEKRLFEAVQDDASRKGESASIFLMLIKVTRIDSLYLFFLVFGLKNVRPLS